MNIQETIERAGLTDKEATIYMTALELGEALITDIAKRANIKRPTAYLAIERLQVLGLVSATKKGKRTLYSAAHPRALLDLVRTREKQIEENLPALVALYNAPKSKPKIQVYEGIEGVRLVYQQAFYEMKKHPDHEIKWFSNPDAVMRYVPEAFNQFTTLVRTLTKPAARELNFFTTATEDWEKSAMIMPGHRYQTRRMPKDLPFGDVDVLFYQNKVAIFSLGKETFTIVIESENIAKSFHSLYEAAWMGAEVLR